MTFFIIGLIISFVMGLTGAGGALISIPLFQYLLGIELKDATALSLLAVVLGVSSNLWDKIKDVRWSLVMGLFLFGIFGNLAMVNFKSQVNDLIIISLLVLISAISIYSIWKDTTQAAAGEAKISFISLGISGFFVGALSTLTGLGGGVVILPVLIRIFKLPYDKALATSLMTIFFISLSSFFLQWTGLTYKVSGWEILSLAVGGIIAAIALKLILKKLKQDNILFLRKFTFTLVTVLALVLLMLRKF